LNFVLHTLATLRFEGVEAVDLEGFGPQNVLDELLVEDLGTAWPARVGVSLPSNNGLVGSFQCAQVVVTRAEPFVPGPRSVYHRSGE
jgi:hypothetical protein